MLARAILRRGGRARRDDDLPPGDARLALGQIALALVERFLNFGVGDVGRHQLSILTQLPRGAGEHLVAADAVGDESLVLVGSAVARLGELGFELRLVREAAAYG